MDTQLIYPVVPIREGVLFPQTESVLNFGRDISLEGIRAAAKTSNNMVVLVSQKKPNLISPKASDLYEVGTLAIIERTIKTEDAVSALVKGLERVKIDTFTQVKPYFSAKVSSLKDLEIEDSETKALTNHLQKSFRKTVQLGKPVEFLNFMKLLGGVKPGELADQVASTLSVATAIKQEILETLNIKERLRLVVKHLTHETKVMEIEKDVVHKTQEEFDKHMREGVLRERLRTIQKELGELEDEEEVASNYVKKLKKLKVSDEIKEKISKEIKRLKQMSPNNPESGYIRSWIDTVFDLPWGKKNKTQIDLKKAQQVLDEAHYGLEEVKDRVLEHIAVLQLKQQNKATKDQQVPTILCFVGPPGVGKTSIGRSIADALGKSFVKISLGGIRDEAEIRGHRRTYVGAMPGKIINGMKQADSTDPIFMLDEIDKVGSDFRGDPSSALLEVLDPEQNRGFVDHYLDIPFDLSQVMFITTANTLDTIPPALRDRLEIIRYTGYTLEEKLQIAKRHLVKKVITANGLNEKNLSYTDSSLEKIIAGYTREAGVRSLERKLHALARKIAKELVTNLKKKKVSITPAKLSKLLGPQEYDENLAEKQDLIGTATGLAWTPVGGDILFIEVALTPGKGKINLTGKLGEVMKESAQAAITYVKAHAKELKINQKIIETTDVHIHVPEGAVPKDGPSAGVTLTTAIISAFTGKPIKNSVAMTGEITLRGKVLRIGGLKEKAIAAHRAGIKTVIIPKDNQRDLIKIAESVKKTITFKPISHIDELLKIVFAK
ncbi:MAG: endopeptidase La [Candidatus Pacebacteria bacterium RIFOXYB1_FULL_39_46]|nr:MAG: endopeptidase La [Candidatus Pacebacteria bacterium RIFOXYA1_FULL_38_18]OGJ38587.1 MAG: endopeptidase La [Candidatus Pacebacteria bacterium RIFOXYB1_FULL_39_46]OGJ40445.1 MAG: endopeptidase La [Candidatus Pacebacteria bacterium RIFOXYC1_FULL_39_21]OGJ40559.1 MAG: endopeptidase La [Candidatus Pacebacteria bacterium RIFOXYD1_FULL_39_27]